jgi:hypothetical protein
VTGDRNLVVEDALVDYPAKNMAVNLASEPNRVLEMSVHQPLPR